MASVIITGSSGFIGHHLVQACQAAGYKTCGIDLRTPPPDAVPDHFTMADIANASWTVHGLDIYPRGSVLVNLAAEVAVAGDPARAPWYVRTNILGTLRAIRMVEAIGGHMILASSGAVAAMENSMGNSNLYGATKQTAEEVCKDSSCSILRFSNVYGPMHKVKGVVGTFINQAKHGERVQIHGDGLQVRDFIHVSDIIQAIMLCIKDRRIGISHLGTGIGTSIMKLNQMVNSRSQDARTLEFSSCSPGIRMSILEPFGLLGWEPKIKLAQGLDMTLKDWKAA